MKTILTAARPLVPGVAIEISERDESGALVGIWKGYWNPDKMRVALYPSYNPYCLWRVPRIKHSVYEGEIRVTRAEKQEKKGTAPRGAGTGAVKSTTEKAMRGLLSGQEKIKF